MSRKWTEATWNPITGCSLVSSGCKNCYAMRLAGGRLKNHSSRRGLTTETPNGPVWNGEVRFNENWLDQPTIWLEPKRIFVVAHGDLFHEKVPFEWIDRVFDVMTDDKCQRHTFQVLTKRPERMKEYVTRRRRLPPNIWIGTSVEDQESAEKRIQHLIETPAHVRWVSAEPLLGPIDLHGIKMLKYDRRSVLMGLEWVVIGGESGPGARPMECNWAGDIIEVCRDYEVAVFMKQLSQASAPGTYKKIEHWYKELQVREYPRIGK